VTVLAAIAMTVAASALAPAAQAAEFHSGYANMALQGTADGTGKNAHHVIDFAGASLTCGVATFSGSKIGATTNLLILEPQYANCTFVGQSASVSTLGCSYWVRSYGSVDINCALPMTVSIPSPSCTVSISSQSGLSAATFANIKPGSIREITMSLSLTGMKYTATGAGCPETGTKSNGNYTTGNTIVMALEKGENLDLWWE